MILEQETFDKFGYYPNELKSKSHKKILASCDICGKIRELPKQGYHNLCFECSYIKPMGTYPIENVVLEIETYDKFNYYPSQLKPKSNKKILVQCSICKEIRELSRWQCSDLCHKCACQKTGKSNKNKRGKDSPNWKGGKQTLNCEYCGKQIQVFPSYIGKHNFCSRTCNGKWRSKNLSGKNSYAWHGGKRIIKCDYCGEEIQRSSSDIYEHNFCNAKCMGEWMSKNRKGESNSHWKGGIANFPYCEKFNKDFKERVREFFERKCFNCSITEKVNGRKLAVHHVNYMRQVCCNKNIIPLFIPLCKRCHSMTNGNRKYWEKYFTERIMEEFDGKCFYTKEEILFKSKNKNGDKKEKLL